MPCGRPTHVTRVVVTVVEISVRPRGVSKPLVTTSSTQLPSNFARCIFFVHMSVQYSIPAIESTATANGEIIPSEARVTRVSTLDPFKLTLCRLMLPESAQYSWSSPVCRAKPFGRHPTTISVAFAPTLLGKPLSSKAMLWILPEQASAHINVPEGWIIRPSGHGEDTTSCTSMPFKLADPIVSLLQSVQ